MNTDTTGCWHCGESLVQGTTILARVGGQQRSMCCHGCRAAAEWIEQLGLADYYQLRTGAAPRPDAAPRSTSASWQRAEAARHVVRDLGAGLRESMLLIEGVRCAACVWLIERVLGAVPGVVSAQVNVLSRRARVVWRCAELSLPQLMETLARTGYRALPLNTQSLLDLRRRESRDMLKRLLVAGFGAMQAMMFAVAIYLNPAGTVDASTRDLLRWLGFLVATPVVFYSAAPFFAAAVRSLRVPRLGMDVPVSLAIAAVYAASLVEALRGSGEVYFDSISMFVFILLAGRYLEMRARHDTGDLTDALARLTPPFADRQLDDGTLQRVGVEELRVGDCVHVAEGGIVPADGVLLSGRVRVDEALLSGESAPVIRRRGDRLIAGTVLDGGPLQLRVDRVGADTTLSGLAALVARAQAERPQAVLAGEARAGRLVLRVLLSTAAAAALWMVFDPSRAFSAAVAVLVISCPCAFALAVPAVMARAMDSLARRGVLVVRPDALQSLAECTHVLFDKTGTLTEASLSLADVQTFNGTSRGEALLLAASLARQSSHPLARALADAHPDPVSASQVIAHAGLGLSGSVAGRELRLGRGEFAAGKPVAADFDDAVLLADDAGLIAAFRFGERLRADAVSMIGALREQGLTVLIASGDAHSRVARIASQLEVLEWRARQLPPDKLAWLAKLRAQGARVLAIGDGVNDAPLLAGADVSIALAHGAQLAQASSDIVLTGERLDGIAHARAVAREALDNMRQNQLWALGYNFTAVPLAALGFIPPWLAALGMSLSSVGVVLNAMRIGRQVARPGARPAILAAHGVRAT